MHMRESNDSYASYQAAIKPLHPLLTGIVTKCKRSIRLLQLNRIKVLRHPSRPDHGEPRLHCATVISSTGRSSPYLMINIRNCLGLDTISNFPGSYRLGHSFSGRSLPQFLFHICFVYCFAALHHSILYISQVFAPLWFSCYS